MARARVEGLLAALPKLVGTGGASKQHTVVETENVRYLYQPLEVRGGGGEDGGGGGFRSAERGARRSPPRRVPPPPPHQSMYLLIITNKGSNIVEDLETLRLLAKVRGRRDGRGGGPRREARRVRRPCAPTPPPQIVPDYVHPLDEEAVAAAAFDVLFAFDEAITLGVRDACTPASIRAAAAMESHEEKLHKMIIASKIADTRDAMKRKAAEIERTKADARAGRHSGGGGGGGYGGGGGGGYGAPGAGGAGFATGGGGFAAPAPAPAPHLPTAPAPKRGLALGGGGGRGRALADALRAEGVDVAAPAAAAAAAAAATAGGPAAPPPPPGEPLTITLEERISATLLKDGGVDGIEVAGTLTVAVHDPAAGRAVVALAPTPPDAGSGFAFQFKAHPNIDKAAYADAGELRLKDPARSFPAGAPLAVLKWRAAGADEGALPLAVTCWPSLSGGDAYVNLEYEARAAFDLRDVVIALPAACPPRVGAIDGSWSYDSRRKAVLWAIDMIDASNATGSAEFVFPAAPAESFFPVDVAFTADGGLAGVAVAAVTDVDGGAPVKHGLRSRLVADAYQVV